MKFTDALIEAINDHTPDFLETARRGYICPVCGNGSGSTGDGITKIPGSNKYFCFKCQAEGSRPDNDVIDLYGLKYNISSFPEKVKQAAAYFGIDPERYQEEQPIKRTPRRKRSGTAAEELTPEEKKAAAAYIVKAYENNNFEYLKGRGISEEIQKRFYIGYDPDWIHPKVEREQVEKLGKARKYFTSPRCIIPRNQYSYLARDTREEIPEDKKPYDKQKINGTGLYYPHAIQPGGTFFIVEGEIDCLSIYEAGGRGVGLGSCANRDLLLDYLQKHPEKTEGTKFILMLDNDETGQKTQDYLLERLQAAGLPVLAAEYPAADPNSFLVEDRKGFINTVSFLQAQAEALEAAAATDPEEEYKKNAASYHLQEFINGIADSVNTPYTSTGFRKLDQVLDGGLYEGLYFIGALPSLGKTTLVTQIADNIAQGGKDVLIFSLEMARAEIMAKSISRHTLLNCQERKIETSHAKTVRGITDGSRYGLYSQAEKDIITKSIKDYSQYAEHIFINEGVGDIGVKEIREAIKNHISFTGETPIVIVDYIQILAPQDVRASDKQNTDKAVLELKRISRDYKTPVIGISSLNRENYNEKISMRAFKESGAIEYGSDVLIGLQLRGAGDKGFDVEKNMKENPRQIELKILKNRNGRRGDIVNFQYYTLFNYFKEFPDMNYKTV